MKKLSLAIILLSSLHTASGYNAAYAAGKTSHSQAEADSIKAVMGEIEAAAKAGDEQLVAKLLLSAIKSHPKIADKIVAAFVSNQDIASTASSQKINVSAIINSVVTNLQNQKGSENLVAAVLSSYTPASGGANNNSNVNNTLPPSLPQSGKIGDNGNVDNKLPTENKNQTSSN